MSMRVKVTVKAFCGMTLLLSIVALISLSVVAWAQQELSHPLTRAAAAEEHVTISEDISFSWTIVVMIVIAATGYAVAAYSVKVHHGDTNVHFVGLEKKDFLTSSAHTKICAEVQKTAQEVKKAGEDAKAAAKKAGDDAKAAADHIENSIDDLKWGLVEAMPELLKTLRPKPRD